MTPRSVYDWLEARGMDKIAYFQNTDLFHGLSEEELKLCERDVPMFRAERGQLVFRPGSGSEALYVIKDGSVRVYRLSREGREITLGTLDAGKVFGTLPMFGGASRDTFAEAATDAVVCRITEPVLQDLIRRHPQIATRLLRVVGERLSALEELAEDLVFRTAEQRVARSLLRLLNGRSRLSVSHEEIAKSAGVARETVTKTLDGMKRRGWIKTGYRSLKVLDRKPIEEQAEE